MSSAALPSRDVVVVVSATSCDLLLLLALSSSWVSFEEEDRSRAVSRSFAFAEEEEVLSFLDFFFWILDPPLNLNAPRVMEAYSSDGIFGRFAFALI